MASRLLKQVRTKCLLTYHRTVVQPCTIAKVVVFGRNAYLTMAMDYMSQRAVKAPATLSLDIEQCLSASELRLTAEVQDLKRIHELSLRLAQTTSLDDVLVDVLRTAASLTEARLGSVQLVTADGSLAMVGQTGFGESIFDKFSIVNIDDCSVCASALRSKSRVIVSDLGANADFAEIAKSLRSFGAASVVSAGDRQRTQSDRDVFRLLDGRASTDRPRIART